VATAGKGDLLLFLNRRLLTLSVAAPALVEVRAATPEVSTPETSFVALTSEEIFEMLLAAPFSSPLVPADAGDIVISEWIDDSDSDLDEAVGGLFFGGSAEGEEASLGAMIVYHDEATAKGRVDPEDYDPRSTMTVNAVSLGGATGLTVVEIDESDEFDDDFSYATTAVSAGFTVISGGAEGLPHDELELRSVANVVAMLDHYQRVVTSIQT
jgi:hypothetical protein